MKRVCTMDMYMMRMMAPAPAPDQDLVQIMVTMTAKNYRALKKKITVKKIQGF